MDIARIKALIMFTLEIVEVILVPKSKMVLTIRIIVSVVSCDLST
jgi:hypothetical protein